MDKFEGELNQIEKNEKVTDEMINDQQNSSYQRKPSLNIPDSSSKLDVPMNHLQLPQNEQCLDVLSSINASTAVNSQREYINTALDSNSIN